MLNQLAQEQLTTTWSQGGGIALTEKSPINQPKSANSPLDITLIKSIEHLTPPVYTHLM